MLTLTGGDDALLPTAARLASARPNRTLNPAGTKISIPAELPTNPNADDSVSLSADGLLAALSGDEGGDGSRRGNLFAVLRGMLEEGLATAMGRGGNGRGPSLTGLMRSMTKGAPQMNRLLQSVDKFLKGLGGKNNQLATDLAALMKALEKLDGKVRNTEGFLTRFEEVLCELSENCPVLDMSALSDPNVAPVAAEGEMLVERFSYTLEIEVSQSRSMEATVAELTDQGFRVQTVRMEETASFKLRIELSGTRERPAQSEPLVLDLDGDGVNLPSYADGVAFDIDGDGVVDQTAFAREGDGVLALDRNGNGRIDNGKELFGDQHGAANGFEELAKFDDNGDQIIDRRDSVFQSLGVIRDANADGRLDPSEFMSLESLGIEAIELLNTLKWEDDGRGNSLAERGVFHWKDGRTGQSADAWFGYEPGSRIDAVG